MICRNCGTENPAGSKFCNNCGAGLHPDANQICPNCQTPNSEDLLYCDNCGTRLAGEHLPEEDTGQDPAESSTGSRSEPFSLPARPSGQTADLELSGEIPDWLKTGEGAESEAEKETTSPAEEGEQHLPEWARAAQERGEGWEDKEAPTLDEVSGDHSPADDLPVWLMDEETSETIFTRDKSTDELFEASGEAAAGEESQTGQEDLPGWLQGLATDTGPGTGDAPAPRQTPAEDSEIPDWLADLDAESPAGGDAEDTDDWEEAGPAAKPAEAIPDWLAELETGAEDMVESERGPAGIEEPAGPIPDWLADVETAAEGAEEIEPATGDVEEPVEEVPDWLAGVETSAEDAEEIEPATTGMEQPAEEIPDWLADLEAGVDDFELPPEEEMADWLADRDEDAGEATAGEQTEWLSELETFEEAPGAKEPAFEDIEETTLDWLSDLDTETTAETEPEESAGEVETESAEPEALEWLTTLEEEPAGDEEIPAPLSSEAERVPGWLAGLEPEEMKFAPADEVDALAGDEETPDWLWEDGEEEIPAEVENEDEFPEWLRGEQEALSEAKAAPDETEPPQDTGIGDLDAGEIPSWLAGTEAAPGPTLADEQEKPETPPAATEPSGEEGPADKEVDDWLSALGEATGDEEETLSLGATPASELPGWLREMAPPDTGPLTPADETAPAPDDLDEFLGDLDDEDELPEWLRGVEAQPAQEAAVDEPDIDIGPQVEQTEDDKALSDWLSDSEFFDEAFARPRRPESVEKAPEETRPTDPEQEPEETLSEPHVPADDLPEWLGDVMGDMDEAESFMFEEEAEDTVLPLPAKDAEETYGTGEEYADWFEDSQPAAEDADREAEPTPLAELPEWLRPPGELEGVSLEEGDRWGDLLDEFPPAEDPGQRLGEAEIPEWLEALKPRDLVEGTEDIPEAEEEETVGAGPLTGLRGVIEIEPIIAEERAAERISGYTVNKEQQQQATLLRQLVQTVPQQAVPVGTERVSSASPLLRILLVLLLLAAILLGFFFPDLIEIPSATPELEQARTLVAEAAPRPVLVAFDYTPAMAGALDAHATLLLEEIAGAGSPVLFASQSAAGLALAEQKVTATSGLSSRRVGYLPGSAVGLRRLAPCLRAEAACQTIYGASLSAETTADLADTALVVVLAGDRESAINWIEQVATTSGKPMLAVVPQAVAPVAAPYYSSGQLAGLLSEPAPAVTAARVSDSPDTPDAVGNQATAVALGQWLVIGLLLVGNLIYFVRGSVRSRTGRSRSRSVP